jgi:ComF family protein
MILKLKYHGDIRAAPPMGRELREKVQQKEWFQQIDAVVPVPLHWRRRLKRRFNQSELLAYALARGTGKPLFSRALRRTRNTAPQATLEYPQRAENTADAFRVARSGCVCGAVILLVDDVMTTCSTAESCTAALRGAGAKAVYVAVYAR